MLNLAALLWRRLLRKRWVLALVFGLSLVYFLSSTFKQVSDCALDLRPSDPSSSSLRSFVLLPIFYPPLILLPILHLFYLPNSSSSSPPPILCLPLSHPSSSSALLQLLAPHPPSFSSPHFLDLQSSHFLRPSILCPLSSSSVPLMLLPPVIHLLFDMQPFSSVLPRSLPFTPWIIHSSFL